MTYQEFKSKYDGKYIDYDGAYGCQCWDLAQYYFTQVLNVPDYVLSGCGYVSKMLYQPKRADLDQYFDEVSVYEMIQGDVVIWDDPTPHIAVFDNWSGKANYYLSQNPNPCQIMECNLKGQIHAFRRKGSKPTPVITPNVPRDEYKNQIEVKVEKLRVRTEPNTNAEVIGFANIGFYNYSNTYKKDKNDYTWYKIADNNWIASSEEWTSVYPAKPKEEYIKLKIIDKKDDYVLVELGKVWIKKV